MNTSTLKQNETRKALVRAFQLVKFPLIIALLITPLRFLLELGGLPESAIFLIGLLWLTLGISIYWAVKLKKDKLPFLILIFALVMFSPISRIPVAILWWIDNKYSIGTHYGLYFDNFPHVILNQVVYGSMVQVIPGFLVGAIVLMIMRYR